ncbi:MAG: hypothetical protein MK085_06925, partial [Phycisphaerales bacterium]|nr:hypothetical protein [Phycisphaerales bacterium]
MRRTRSLFRLDAGWLFLVAGLAMLAAIVLIPEEEERRLQTERLDALQREGEVLTDRMRRLAYSLELLEQGDQDFHERVIESRLRRIRSDRSVQLVAESINGSIGDWADGLGAPPQVASRPQVHTMLSSMLGSGFRLWLLGGAALSIFIGLVLGGAAEPLVMDIARKLIGRSHRVEEGGAEPHIFASEDGEVDGDETEEDHDRDDGPVSEWAPSNTEVVSLAERFGNAESVPMEDGTIDDGPVASLVQVDSAEEVLEDAGEPDAEDDAVEDEEWDEAGDDRDDADEDPGTDLVEAEEDEEVESEADSYGDDEDAEEEPEVEDEDEEVDDEEEDWDEDEAEGEDDEEEEEDDEEEDWDEAEGEDDEEEEEDEEEDDEEEGEDEEEEDWDEDEAEGEDDEEEDEGEDEEEDEEEEDWDEDEAEEEDDAEEPGRGDDDETAQG